jgi:hypothetical protein
MGTNISTYGHLGILIQTIASLLSPNGDKSGIWSNLNPPGGHLGQLAWTGAGLEGRALPLP